MQLSQKIILKRKERQELNPPLNTPGIEELKVENKTYFQLHDNENITHKTCDQRPNY